MRESSEAGQQNSKSHPRLSERDRQVLSAQQITPASPGSILGDIQVLLDFIGSAGLSTKSDEGNLPSAVLPELNARLSQPIEVGFQRLVMRRLPNIAGPYVLLRVMDLVRAAPGRVRVGEEELAVWTGLNPTERYFALMEAWLAFAEDAVLGSSHRGRWDTQSKEILRFLLIEASSSWKTYGEWIHKSCFGASLSNWNAQLMARFGLIAMRPRSMEDRGIIADRGWMMGQARLTPWGAAVRHALLDFFGLESASDLILDDPCEGLGYGFLKPVFEPYFPELQRGYAPAGEQFRPGLHIFKVSLGRVWRRFAVPASNTPDHLARAILAAFKFDDEHLYDFKYRDQRGKKHEFNHPFSQEGPCTTDVRIGQMLLREKEAMTFLYDYGDCWEFSVRLERVEPPDKKVRRPKLIGSAGKAPEQYPDADEDW